MIDWTMTPPSLTYADVDAFTSGVVENENDVNVLVAYHIFGWRWFPSFTRGTTPIGSVADAQLGPVQQWYLANDGGGTPVPTSDGPVSLPAWSTDPGLIMRDASLVFAHEISLHWVDGTCTINVGTGTGFSAGGSTTSPEFAMALCKALLCWKLTLTP